MSDGIYMLALAFGAYVIFSLFYEYAARPMLCDRVRFRIFALRDQLRRLAIDEKISAESFEYIYLERFLCRLIEKCSWLSWSSLIEFIWKNRANARELPPDAVKFEAEANDTLKGIYYTAIMESIGAMLVNSPIWTLFLPILLCFGKLFGWAIKQWVEFKTKIFLEEPISDTGLTA
jgi:hypothetical protein